MLSQMFRSSADRVAIMAVRQLPPVCVCVCVCVYVCVGYMCVCMHMYVQRKRWESENKHCVCFLSTISIKPHSPKLSLSTIVSIQFRYGI